HRPRPGSHRPWSRPARRSLPVGGTPLARSMRSRSHRPVAGSIFTRTSAVLTGSGAVFGRSSAVLTGSGSVFGGSGVVPVGSGSVFACSRAVLVRSGAVRVSTGGVGPLARVGIGLSGRAIGSRSGTVLTGVPLSRREAAAGWSCPERSALRGAVLPRAVLLGAVLLMPVPAGPVVLRAVLLMCVLAGPVLLRA